MCPALLLDKPQQLYLAKCAAGGIHPGPRECVSLAAAPSATRLPWAQPQPSELALRVVGRDPHAQLLCDGWEMALSA